MIIREIPSKQTHDIRHEVLRPGRPRETCVFEGDDLPFAKHFGAFEDDHLLGTASVFPVNSNAFPEENQLQMRGMAVLPKWQGTGIGALLLREAERYAKEKHFSILWFNARVAAVPFYKKMGYEISGTEFEVTDVGPHYIMFKKFPQDH